MTPSETVADVLTLLRAERYEDIRELFAPALRPLVTADTLRAGWTQAVGSMGALESAGEPESTGAVVTVPLRFERGELALQVSLTDSGALTGLQLVPPDAAPPESWQPPDYAAADRFDEEEVTLGEGPSAVPGTLTLPRVEGRRPGIVLLGGSGPTDRDSTIGPNKPFKDLAWGLATLGIAVLRFDKITVAHPDLVRANRAFTVVDEYLPDALAALRLLAHHPRIDTDHVVLAGHSLGGTVAPRVAAAWPSSEHPLAGVVLLAGGAQPLQWAAVRQVRHLASLNPATADTAMAAGDALAAQARRVDSPDLSPDTPDDLLPFGTPAPYWLDLRSYDQVATAAALGCPLLLCQGERDYQATVDDDLAVWQAGLRGRSDVTVRTYPADNHFFLSGSGPSNPAELSTPHHVDPHLVADIHDWVTRTGDARGSE